MGERLGEGRDSSPEQTLEDCRTCPEIIDELSFEECEQILELAQAKVMEIYEPALKAAYKVVIQKILQRYTKTAHGTSRPPINIGTGYEITTPDGPSTMVVNTCEISNFGQTTLIGIDQSRVVRHESSGYLCTITDIQHRFWINLKIFILKQRDGSELRLLFIADWYVNPALREQGIGRRLQDLAEQIGQQNYCGGCFGILMPEKPDDLPRLKAAKQHRGYQITDVDGSTIAHKKLNP